MPVSGQRVGWLSRAAARLGDAMKSLVLFMAVMPLLTPARAAEIAVVSQANVAAALRKIADRFETDTGSRVSLAFGNPGVTLERLRKGEPADVVIVSTTILDTVLAEGHVDKSSRVEIARGRIGIGVAADAPVAAMTDKASFIALLRAARTIALVDPAGGGGTSPPFMRAVEALGLAMEIAPKYRMFKGAGEAVAEAVARHEADIGVTAMSELIPNPHVRPLGPIPREAMDWSSITSAAVGARARSPDTAARFVAFLSSDFARAAFRESGME